MLLNRPFKFFFNVGHVGKISRYYRKEYLKISKISCKIAHAQLLKLENGTDVCMPGAFLTQTRRFKEIYKFFGNRTFFVPSWWCLNEYKNGAF